MRIYLSSGVIDRHIDAWNHCNVRNGLLSYWFIRNNPDIFEKLNTLESVMIDSGVYTFIRNPKFLVKYFDTKNPQVAIKKYTEEYVDWLYENQDKYDFAVEMDLYPLFPEDFIFWLQDRYFKPFQRDTGKTIIFALHQHGLSDWNRIIYDDEVRMIALASKITMEQEKFLYWANKCYRLGKPVHGFGITKVENLTRIPFSTVDSSVVGDSLVYYSNRHKPMQLVKIEELFRYCDKFCSFNNGKRVYGMFNNMNLTLTLDNNHLQYKPVIKYVVKHTVTKLLYKFVLEDGSHIICTDDHSLIDIGMKNNFIEKKPSDYKIGDNLICCYGNGYKLVKVKDIEILNTDKKPYNVYDLSVGEYERFFANGILVHNTTWMSSDKYGEHFYFDKSTCKLKRIYARDPKDLAKYYIGGMSKYTYKELLERYTNNARLYFAIEQFQKIEEFCTELWQKRGYDLENMLQDLI